VRFKSIMVSKPQVCLASKLSRHQRSDGDCALRLSTPVSSKTTITLCTPLGLMDSRQYRDWSHVLLMSTRMRVRGLEDLNKEDSSG
jgi:hypothetical protein